MGVAEIYLRVTVTHLYPEGARRKNVVFKHTTVREVSKNGCQK